MFTIVYRCLHLLAGLADKKPRKRQLLLFFLGLFEQLRELADKGELPLHPLDRFLQLVDGAAEEKEREVEEEELEGGPEEGHREEEEEEGKAVHGDLDLG